MRRADASVDVLDDAPAETSLNDTGTGFMVGMAYRGATSGEVTEDDVITSLGEWVTGHGARQSYNGPEYDAVEAFFTERGARLYYRRYVGPAAVKASITVPASSPQGTFHAKDEGAWANGGTITITAGVATIDVDGTVEVSDTLATVGDLADFVANSSVVDYTPGIALTTALANSAARTLAGGDDDRTNAGNTQRTAALAAFGKDLGPGSVAIPGITTIAAHTAIATHCRDMGIRFGYGDAPDTSSAATAAAAGTAVRALGTDLARHIQILEPWIIGPGTADASTRECPPSGMQMGMAARNDAVNPPSKAVAGRNAISRFARGVKYNRSAAELDTLANAGVTSVRSIKRVVQTFDDLTPVDENLAPQWTSAAVARLVMRVTVDALDIAYAHLFSSPSGPPDIDAVRGDISGMLAGWLQRKALFSRDGSPADAFRVVTGPPVNTPETLATRKLKAAMAIRPATTMREVEFTITNTPLQNEI